MGKNFLHWSEKQNVERDNKSLKGCQCLKWMTLGSSGDLLNLFFFNSTRWLKNKFLFTITFFHSWNTQLLTLWPLWQSIYALCFENCTALYHSITKLVVSILVRAHLVNYSTIHQVDSKQGDRKKTFINTLHKRNTKDYITHMFKSWPFSKSDRIGWDLSINKKWP